MRIEGDWLSRPATQAALRIAGEGALIVGGAVRNAIQGKPINDVDIATPLPPQEVLARAAKAGVKAVPTGLDHGTVTLVIDGTPFEVTTFRRDVETDGRHATVAFAEDAAVDASRRDFTMNALYARADGTVVDPLGGVEDARAGRVRFVGDPDARITEDYLRILRFFRFHAIYGTGEPGQAGVAASARHAAKLDRLSAERIGAEMRKLLGAQTPAGTVAAMAGAGVLTPVLPGFDLDALRRLEAVERHHDLAPHWPRRLAALGGARDRLRLSKAEEAEVARLRSAPEAEPHALGHLLGADAARDVLALRGTLDAQGLGELALGAAARFPLSGRDLAGRIEPGPALGAELSRLRDLWIASRFTLDRDALLAEVGSA
ncbi:CCA tRNA nucleotidyltransferase [Roseobacter sp. HKCCA0434]|uniref:CCA tRNA nucleotidyltransferase n=1 Tax=Roseobacter sp. HKCCA0434 TaxID=3079297 RepID=UPI002905E259|nr:CCA tRNA nucleotidyltransferase [Roseobacter sp. HKCCA0434]